MPEPDRRLAYSVPAPVPGQIASWRAQLAAGASPASVAASVRWAVLWHARGRATSRAGVVAAREAVAYRVAEVLVGLGVDLDDDAVGAALEPSPPVAPRPTARQRRRWVDFSDVFAEDAAEIPLRRRRPDLDEVLAATASFDVDTFERRASGLEASRRPVGLARLAATPARLKD
ncbi:hypothetical protein GCM10009616_18290 [Microlunatus lacustris]